MAGRSAASIQAEINVLEAYLASTDSTASSVSSRGTSIVNVSRADASARLDALYLQLGRIDGTAPMIVRGVVKGLG